MAGMGTYGILPHGLPHLASAHGFHAGCDRAHLIARHKAAESCLESDSILRDADNAEEIFRIRMQRIVGVFFRSVARFWGRGNAQSAIITSAQKSSVVCFNEGCANKILFNFRMPPHT
jgi:hypothetical protein